MGAHDSAPISAARGPLRAEMNKPLTTPVAGQQQAPAQQELKQRLERVEEEAATLRLRLRERTRRLVQLQLARDQFETRLAAAQGTAQAERAALQAALAAAEHGLSTIYASLSWRLTAPLRGIASRHPGTGRFVRRLGRLGARLVFRPLRALRRLAPVPASVSKPELTPAAEASLPANTPVLAVRSSPGEPRLWFFLGDTIDWLRSFGQLTGVGRVTTQLFFAALRDGEQPPTPCALPAEGPAPTGLSVEECVYLLSPHAGDPPLGSLLANGDAPLQAAFAPAPGDHVVFTGLVWTPDYVALFRRLHAQGVRFSVLGLIRLLRSLR